ncbi:hypothetical protein FOA52_016176 [Chlamydomonas sp. UWO 241]|nr:hypothetical protein FOA52_016176 [Chlamydomonas sp. UWO 241]
MPNIASMLPTYVNEDAQFIFRTFTTGNYDALKHLPQTIKEQQVNTNRAARMTAAHQFLMPGLGQPVIKGRRADQVPGDLFSTFEYMPSRYSLADELASKARVEGEAKRMAIGGKEFIVPGDPRVPKCTDGDGTTFPSASVGTPYIGGPQAAMQLLTQETGEYVGKAPWTKPGIERIGEGPSRALSWDMMRNIRDWVSKDWQGADVTVFENDEDCWVMRVPLESVDSEAGLAAYMNVFMRCDAKVNDYRLTKVSEFWGTSPGDGGVYFVMRPPWVHHEKVQAFFTAHPEEKKWNTSLAVTQLAATRPTRKESDFAQSHQGASELSYASRLAWGTNFYTGEAGAGAGSIVPPPRGLM